mmetsp:Transcript_4250/g.8252  ORF Transcript_4250/g.8252 Transcript_4250/m.8252 type:complete len:87 (-) Transcript_4250:15-275(-)
MRIRSAHACKRASENEHTGRGGDGCAAPRSASGCHAAVTACDAGSGGGGGAHDDGSSGGGKNGSGGLGSAPTIMSVRYSAARAPPA